MIKRPIIIDTDPGVDDTIAIMLANAHPEFDIKAITPVLGSGWLYAEKQRQRI